MKEIKYPSHLLNETGLTCNTFQFLEERLEHDEVKIRFHVVFNKDGQAFYQSQSFIFELTRLANKSCSWVRCNRREESMPFAPRFLGTLFEEEEGHLTFDGLRISGKAERAVKQTEKGKCLNGSGMALSLDRIRKASSSTPTSTVSPGQKELPNTNTSVDRVNAHKEGEANDLQNPTLIQCHSPYDLRFIRTFRRHSN